MQIYTIFVFTPFFFTPYSNNFIFFITKPSIFVVIAKNILGLKKPHRRTVRLFINACMFLFHLLNKILVEKWDGFNSFVEIEQRIVFIG